MWQKNEDHISMASIYPQEMWTTSMLKILTWLFFFFFFLVLMSRLNMLSIIDMIPWIRRKTSFPRVMHRDSLRFTVNSWGLASFENIENIICLTFKCVTTFNIWKQEISIHRQYFTATTLCFVLFLCEIYKHVSVYLCIKNFSRKKERAKAINTSIICARLFYKY